MNDFKIYVSDLKSYNNGFLVGAWINLPNDNIEKEINDIFKLGNQCLKDNNLYDGYECEEYVIHDQEGFEDFYKVVEYDSPYKLNDLAEFLENLDEWDEIKVEILLYDYATIEEILENGLDAYDVEIYECSSFYKLAQNFYNKKISKDIPNHLKNYIDYELIGSDLSMDYGEYNGYIYKVN